MDSDGPVTADSLSSPDQDGSSMPEGFSGMLSSFSTQGPLDNMSSSRRSDAPLDSFDLSPATDASAGGGGFPQSRDSQPRRPSSHDASGGAAAGLTPLSESRRSSSETLLHHEQQQETAQNRRDYHEHGSKIGPVGVEPLPNESRAGGVGLAQRVVSDRARKRSRDAATIDGGYAVADAVVDVNGWQQQPSQYHRLESSWPLSRAARPNNRHSSSNGADDNENSWGLSQPSFTPASLSMTGNARTARPSSRDHNFGLQTSTSSQRLSGNEDIVLTSRGSFERHGNRDQDGGSESRCSSSDSGDRSIASSGGGRGSDTNSNTGNRGSVVSSSNGAPLSGGLGEVLSVSEASSRGLPAPPIIPSGPLPSIGALREVRCFKGELLLCRSSFLKRAVHVASSTVGYS